MFFCIKKTMKKFSILILTLFITTVANADVASQALNKVSEKISSTIGNLIPGEGITETSVELRDNNEGSGNYKFSILGVRDISSEESSNLFTQFSIHTQEINKDKFSIKSPLYISKYKPNLYRVYVYK